MLVMHVQISACLGQGCDGQGMSAYYRPMHRRHSNDGSCVRIGACFKQNLNHFDCHNTLLGQPQFLLRSCIDADLKRRQVRGRYRRHVQRRGAVIVSRGNTCTRLEQYFNDSSVAAPCGIVQWSPTISVRCVGILTFLQAPFHVGNSGLFEYDDRGPRGEVQAGRRRVRVLLTLGDSACQAKGEGQSRQCDREAHASPAMERVCHRPPRGFAALCPGCQSQAAMASRWAASGTGPVAAPRLSTMCLTLVVAGMTQVTAGCPRIHFRNS